MTHILACTDGSIYADSVYDHTAWAAKRIDASIEVLHVIDHHREHADTQDFSGNMSAGGREALLNKLAELDAEKSKILQAQGRDILEAASDHLKNNGIESPKQTLRNGSLIETVADIEDRADLLVVGKRGEAADFATMHLGANLERVVRGSKHPVLVTSRAFRPIKKVLIAYDGGPTSKKALDWAANGKLLKDLDILLLRVGTDKPENHESLKAAASLLDHTGGHVTTMLKPGVSDEVIAETVNAEDVDLMVVGAYGHSRIRHLLVGSTTTSLIRTCQVPLLMVR